MDIYASLFSASIALAGFIAVFLVFRYNTMDNRADIRKSRIRSLLKEEFKNDPFIDVKVQDIGKESEEEDVCYFCEKLTNKEELANRAKNAVKRFVEDIHAYKRLRDLIVWLGLACISIWGALSLFYLIIHAISPCHFSGISCSMTLAEISVGFFISSGLLPLIYVISSLSNSISCSAMVIGISIGLFIKSMALTLCFVWIALLKGPIAISEKH
jgi:uncharacterized membrane protein